MRLFFDRKKQFDVTFAGANERKYGIKVVQKFQLYAVFPPRRDDNHIVEIRQKSQLYAAFPPIRDDNHKVEIRDNIKRILFCFTRRSTLRFGRFSPRERA
jgi:hypothetical protein